MLHSGMRFSIVWIGSALNFVVVHPGTPVLGQEKMRRISGKRDMSNACHYTNFPTVAERAG